MILRRFSGKVNIWCYALRRGVTNRKHVCAVRRLARQIAQELGVVPEAQRPLAASLMDQALNQTAGEAAAAGAPAANRSAPSGR